MSNISNTMFKLKTNSIKKKTLELNNKLVGLYEKVNEDPNKVDIGEIYNGVIDYALLVNKYCNFYENFGYSFLKEEEKQSFHYKLLQFFPELAKLDSLLRKIEEKKNLEENNTNLAMLMNEIHIRSEIAEYIEPINPIIAELKRYLLCNTISISYKSLVQNQPIKESEYKKLIDSYHIYFNHEELHLNGGVLYPQFGESIVKLLTELENKVVYNNSDQENHQKVRK